MVVRVGGAACWPRGWEVALPRTSATARAFPAQVHLCVLISSRYWRDALRALLRAEAVSISNPTVAMPDPQLAETSTSCRAEAVPECADHMYKLVGRDYSTFRNTREGGVSISGSNLEPPPCEFPAENSAGNYRQEVLPGTETSF